MNSKVGSTLEAPLSHNESTHGNLTDQPENVKTKKPRENVSLHEVCQHLSTCDKVETRGIEPLSGGHQMPVSVEEMDPDQSLAASMGRQPFSQYRKEMSVSA